MNKTTYIVLEKNGIKTIYVKKMKRKLSRHSRRDRRKNQSGGPREDNAFRSAGKHRHVHGLLSAVIEARARLRPPRRETLWGLYGDPA